jgi:orotate phosphoribosyltransferase
MKPLGPTRLLTAAGKREDMPLDRQWAYRQRWEQQGYELPPWDPPAQNATTTLKNAGRSATRTAKRLLTGKSVAASAEVAAERLAICNNCPTHRLRESNRQCSACSCFVDFKVRLAGESCPDGHWAASEVPRRKKRRVARAAADRPRRRRTKNAFQIAPGTPRFITGCNLMRDTKVLMSKLPPNISAVVGVARSGLDVAAIIAKHLHVPLWSAAQNRSEIVSCGSGWRIQVGSKISGPVLLVDDTVMTGNSQKAVVPWVRRKFPDLVTAAVYVNPNAKVKPDLWAVDLPWPHILEWNVFNSVLSPHVAVDFDGILCYDCPPGDDDDGPRYRRFLETARPLYLPRRVPIPLIVTARLEKYRQPTEAWLRRHGIRWGKLVMGPWGNLKERHKHDMGAYKARHFEEWARRHRATPPPLMFMESDDRQAQTIARITRRLVVCPGTGKCYQ